MKPCMETINKWTSPLRNSQKSLFGFWSCAFRLLIFTAYTEPRKINGHLTDGGRHVVFWKAREAWYQFCIIRKSTMSMSRKRVGTKRPAKRSLLFQTEKISISLSKWDFYSQKVWRTLFFFDLKKNHKTTTYLRAKFRDKEQNTDRLT